MGGNRDGPESILLSEVSQTERSEYGTTALTGGTEESPALRNGDWSAGCQRLGPKGGTFQLFGEGLWGGLASSTPLLKGAEGADLKCPHRHGNNRGHRGR